MLPILVDLKFLKVYTFGVFLVLAFFWSAFMLWRNIRLTSYKEEDVFDSLFLSILSGLFIGRLLYVVFNFKDFGFDILKFILINGYPGMSLYGTVLGGFIGLYLYSLAKKVRFLDLVDYFVSPLLIALGIGKLGSFFSGAEIGAKTKFPLAIRYAGFDGFRHLTALYEGILFLIGAFVAYKLLFEIRRQKYDRGFSFFFFWWFFGLVYAIFDKLKSVHLSFITPDSLNLTFSLTILLTFTVYFLYYFRNLIISRVLSAKHSVIDYGKAAGSKLRKGAKKETGRGAHENTETG